LPCGCWFGSSACVATAKLATIEITGTAIVKRLKARMVFFSTATRGRIMDHRAIEIYASYGV
jgi:hypothetical protein